MLFQKHLYLKYFIITSLFCCVSFCGYSQNQNITIEGTLKDVEGMPNSFTTVRVKHSKGGTYTSDDGSFTLGGIKLGDTLVFTNVSWQKAYFVVDRKYNVLNFKLLRDTANVFISEYSKSSSFGASHSYLQESNTPYIKAEYIETTNPVREIKNFDWNKVFTKVEVNAQFFSSYPKFVDSLSNDINKLKPKLKPQKVGDILVYLWIRSDKKIDVNTVQGDVKDEVKTIFKKRFESITNILPAIQNGRNVGALAVAKFQLDITKDKMVTLKLVN